MDRCSFCGRSKSRIKKLFSGPGMNRMRPIVILICFMLVLSFISYPAYAGDSVIKEELIKLQALIDETPPFFFKDGIRGKSAFEEKVKNAASLAEDNRLKEAGNMIHYLLAELESRLVITNPVSRDKIRKMLIEILKKITQD